MDLSVHEGEIPIPISSNYVGGSGSHVSHSFNHHNHLQTPTPLSSSSPLNSKKLAPFKYRECLKNHAASIGGNATDGCGEFMPSGEEGTLEALKCSACNCHRNFHRKEIDAFVYNTIGTSNQKIIPFSSMHNSEYDEMEARFFPPQMAKKRFRTKFTAEQKEKMLGFAESVGWRLQKQEERLVQELCNEIGIKRRVLKVWMHNNKHNLAKKTNNLLLQ